MLAFENVTYEYYTDTLGRAAIPDEASFDEVALEAKLYVNGLYVDGLIEEIDENGFDNAACMIAEELYKAALARTEGGAVITAESLGDYSYSAAAGSVEEAERALSRAKAKWLYAYCYVWTGLA